jgi:hypothetical protein
MPAASVCCDAQIDRQRTIVASSTVDNGSTFTHRRVALV